MLYKLLTLALCVQVGASLGSNVDAQRKIRERYVRCGIDPEVATLIAFPLDRNSTKPRKAVNLMKVMNGDQLAGTGVGKISAVQRDNLEFWITDALDRTVQDVMKSTAVYGGVNSTPTHSIKDWTASGTVIELEDGSLWQIDQASVKVIAGWTRAAILSVSEPDKGDYPYRILNEKQIAHARLVGRVTVK